MINHMIRTIFGHVGGEDDGSNHAEGWAYQSDPNPSNLQKRMLDDYGGGYSYSDAFAYFANMTGIDYNGTDFDAQLVPAEDVSVSAVLSSLVFNTIAFILLMCSYECLRRLLPTVYSSRKRLDRIHITSNDPSTSSIGGNESAESTPHQHNFRAGSPTSNTPYHAFAGALHNLVSSGGSNDNNHHHNNNANDEDATNLPGNFGGLMSPHDLRQTGLLPLPDDKPLDWVFPVFGVPWNKVRKIAGLDGYFFLRYIRMNVRITAVSSFWFFVILVPIYGTGGGSGDYQPKEQQQQDNVGAGGYTSYYQSATAKGWYYFSAANIPTHGWRIWAPVLFCYLFSGFIMFVIKQEYRHFLEIRQDFLARGTAHIDPQHHYSLMIENVPYELRSDRALKEYFEKLFPGRVHSASVVLKLPDLEELSARCLRTCRRLEKSIAFLHATKTRPSHIVGRGRLSILGVDLAPVDCHGCATCGMHDEEPVYVEDGRYVERPERGTRVDSISYYTQELAADSRALFKMQQRKGQIAESGNLSFQADNWLNQAVRDFSAVADGIIEDSMLNNDLLASEDDSDDVFTPNWSPRSQIAEFTKSQYGSFAPTSSESPTTKANRIFDFQSADSVEREEADDDNRGIRRAEGSDAYYETPFASDQYKNRIRRWAGRLGLDFVVAVLKTMNRQLDVALEGVIGATMSSTGFVTFLDLSSTTCAVSAPLTVKATTLCASVAPEPREIRWYNAHVSKQTQVNRELIANIVLTIGGFFWSFPLAAIQAFAKAKYLAQIPGMEWIETFHGGVVSSFVNGYLPVLALLGLILILPLIFEYVATNYEHRKTFSDIQASMLGRYFYYQLITIYVSVTAGSLLRVMANIIDHPSAIFELLGESLPSMAGYFIALLITKIMAGLPMIFLRFGALSRMLLLRIMSSEPKLTQRELDSVYRLENVQYGWEFPTQLLVVVIVFTYAVICPAILPFGLVYFVGALTVYKKQILYVYSPVYESGGAMFPMAVQRTLFGLVCSQVTLIGYLTTRGCRYQTLFLMPLPVLTIFGMGYFNRTYAEPSKKLSLERAREYDRLCAIKFRKNGVLEESRSVTKGDMENALEARRRQFDKCAYRQPVLTELPTLPMTYRRGVEDQETMLVRDQLSRVNRYVSAPTDHGVDSSFQSPIV